MTKWSWRVLVIGGLLSATAFAANGETVTGKQLFQEGKYQQALEYFRRQDADGRGSQVNTYNMAVCLYRLHRYNEARRLFLSLTPDSRWRPLANYNLGLIARVTSNPEEAKHYFRLAADQQTNSKIRSLALSRLDAYPRESTTHGRWIALVRARAGHDTNAARLAPDLLATSSQGADNYMELLGFAQTWLTGRPDDGVKFYALGLDRRFNTFHSVDTQVIGGNLSYEHRFYGVQTESAVRLLHTSIDGVSVSSQLQARLALSQEFADNILSVAWLPSHYFSSSAYPQVEGSQQRLEFTWKRYTPVLTLTARYRYETNSRADLSQGASFASYSPTRNAFKGEALWHITPHLRSDFFVKYRHSVYAGVNSLVDTNGMIKTAQRTNDMTTAGTWFAYQVAAPWSLRFTYMHVSSTDTFDLYAYSSSRYSASIEYIFF